MKTPNTCDGRQGSTLGLMREPLISTGLQPGVCALNVNSRFNGFSFAIPALRRVKTVETVLPSLPADTRLKPGANKSGHRSVSSVPAFLLS